MSPAPNFTIYKRQKFQQKIRLYSCFLLEFILAILRTTRFVQSPLMEQLIMPELYFPDFPFPLRPSCQNATALAAATLRESTPCPMGMHTV